MSMDSIRGRRGVRIGLALLLAVCLMAALPVVQRASADAYYDESVNKLVAWNILNGYPDGSMRPENSITRAEYLAMINRSYGFHRTGSNPFNDVAEEAWYAPDVSIAHAAGYFTGYTDGSAQPEEDLTREQAMVLLAKNMRLDEIPGEITEFSDGREFGIWARGYVKAAVAAGLINGYPDGTFRPGNSITRGEMAVLLHRALGNLVYREGSYYPKEAYGNVTINLTNVTLRDTTVAGDVFITGGLGLGAVVLDNVDVMGKIVIAGGGESEAGQDSVILRDVTADALQIDSLANQYVSVRAEGNTAIPQTSVRSEAYIEDRTPVGSGLQNIVLEGETGDNYTLSGNIEHVVNKTRDANLKVSRGSVQTLTMDEYGQGSGLVIDTNTTVRTLNLDTATHVTGAGDVESVVVNTTGSSTEMLPDQISVRPGITTTIAGSDMDNNTAQQSSDTPRLLAGYPQATEVTSTTAKLVFSTNKAGTVYWAITSVSDGSASESVLLSPATGRNILSSGNLLVTEAEKEFKVEVKSLSSGASYYLAAILVDSRGMRSPVKAISFSTTDDSVPAFTSGFPQVVDITSHSARCRFMTTKDCDLYWALYAKGSAAPTAADFRSGALTGSLQNGRQNVSRNTLDQFDMGDLEEEGEYDLYLWLNDIDGAKSSAVRKLNFNTIDGTRPVFNTIPTVTAYTANSLRLVCNVDENATVYWAVVREGYPDFPQPATGQSRLDVDAAEDYAYVRRQLMNGTNADRYGKVSVKANTDATINISGLTGQRYYYVYYMAVDTAGNATDWRGRFSEDGTELLERITAQTLDNVRPTVTLTLRQQQEGKYTYDGVEDAYATTDVWLRFSESVGKTEAIRDERISFYTLYQEVLTATSNAEREAAMDALGTALEATIKLYNAENNRESIAQCTDAERADGTWVIDYRRAVVEIVDEQMIVKFHNSEAKTDDERAINLKSGSDYYFVLSDIEDMSNAPSPNLLNPNPTRLPDNKSRMFHVVDAQVSLRAVNITNTRDDGTGTVIDMAFSVTPDSTQVDPGLDWDLLLLSNTSVRFEIYRRAFGETAANTWSDWTKIVPGDVATNPNYNRIIVPGYSSDNYQGKSLFHDFYGLKNNPSVVNNTAKGSGNYPLLEGQVYQYGIHFTEVDNVAEAVGRDGTWDQVINFKIYVAAGSSVGLSGLATEVTEANYERLQGREIDPVRDIGTPAPFTLEKQFADQTAPTFYDHYPTFNATDVNVTMTVMLDRPGTVYYVVAPFDFTTQNLVEPTIPTRPDDVTAQNYEPFIQVAGGNIYIKGQSDGNDMYAGGVPRAGDVDSWGLGEYHDYLLELPTPSAIYSPNFGSTRIHTGSFEVKQGATDVTVPLVSNRNEPELEPDTNYFIYFILKGTGQVYSDRVILFQFRTPEVSRPELRLATSGTTIVNMTTDEDSVVNYALFRMDRLQNTIFNSVFAAEALDTEKWTVEEFCEEVAAKLRLTTEQVNNITVLEAMNYTYTSEVNDGSLFDCFASASYKDLVRDQIRSTVQGNDGVRFSGGTATLTAEKSEPVDCAGKTINIPNDIRYAFVALARRTAADANVSGNSLAYRSIYPIYKLNTEQNKIDTITPHLTIQVKTDPTTGAAVDDWSYEIGGYIEVYFEKNLCVYYEHGKDGNATLPEYKFVDLAPLSTHNSTAGYEDYISVKEILNTGSRIHGIELATADEDFEAGQEEAAAAAATAALGGRTRMIRLRVSGAVTGDEIVLTKDLCAENSAPGDDQLHIWLEYNTATGQIRVYATPSWCNWYDKKKQDNYAEVTPEVLGGSVTLNTNRVTLTIGDPAAEVQATLNPPGTQMRWSIGDSGTASVVASATTQTTALVTPVGVGKTNLEAIVQGGGTRSIEVYVNPTLSSTSLEMLKNNRQTLRVNVGTNSGSFDYEWDSSDPSVKLGISATSNPEQSLVRSKTSSVTLFAESKGEADVTCTVVKTVTDEDGNTTEEKYSATCHVVVNVIPLTGVTTSPATLTLAAGASGTITVTALPSNATDLVFVQETTANPSGVLTVNRIGNSGTYTVTALPDVTTAQTVQLTITVTGVDENGNGIPHQVTVPVRVTP